MAYYNDAQKNYVKALEVCDQILFLAPNEPQTLKIREALKKNVEKKSGGEKTTKPAANTKSGG